MISSFYSPCQAAAPVANLRWNTREKLTLQIQGGLTTIPPPAILLTQDIILVIILNLPSRPFFSSSIHCHSPQNRIVHDSIPSSSGTRQNQNFVMLKTHKKSLTVGLVAKNSISKLSLPYFGRIHEQMNINGSRNPVIVYDLNLLFSLVQNFRYADARGKVS
ncbi:hypothetical protein PoB_002139300 [Plakobranchus ocellatus]|uniref:Uncharacterized protein n=1 Tax=Plakobranchus ocellatus TaxID=259542 RepID=A0AAV3ZK34_9GAST|nr:hypothetical protein PoB_002139300 [Plakobranchus ocellatus]